MTTDVHKTTQLGELVVAVFDEAARYSADSREVSRLATRAVSRIVRRSRRELCQPARVPMRRADGS
jgi:hypothetical protein